MNSFRNQRLRNHALPMSTAWLFNDIAEAKGRQELFTRQSPQMLKALREAAIIQSAESSNRIEGVTVAPDRLRPLVLGNTKPRDLSLVAADVSPLHLKTNGSKSRLTSAATVDGFKTRIEALQRSSQRWHEGKHELTPWINFLLAIIRRGCAEFENRAGQIKSPRGAKTALVEQAINSFPAQFSIAEIERICPGVSRDMLRHILNRLQRQKQISCVQRGRNSLWQKKQPLN